MKTVSLLHVSIGDISIYFVELTLLPSLIKIKKSETIFKGQVYNGSEKTRVKQHKILRGYLLVKANLKFVVSFLRA